VSFSIGVQGSGVSSKQVGSVEKVGCVFSWELIWMAPTKKHYIDSVAHLDATTGTVEKISTGLCGYYLRENSRFSSACL